MSHGTDVNESWHTCTRQWVMAHIWMGHDTHMWWLRLVGSLKLYVSFAKKPYKRDNILQKRPEIYGSWHTYGVATISGLLQIIGLFCRISSLLCGSFAKETYYFKEPTSRSHPICLWMGNIEAGLPKIGMHSFIRMGWLQSVGSIKLYVSFAEYCLFYKALLQKRSIILSILLTEATHRPAQNRNAWFHT